MRLSKGPYSIVIYVNQHCSLLLEYDAFSSGNLVISGISFDLNHVLCWQAAKAKLRPPDAHDDTVSFKEALEQVRLGLPQALLA